MKNHKDLIVWQKSMDLVLAIYKATRSFPQEEMFGIVSQMRRASVSIPSNIAEGFGRLSEKETERFLSIALGSASELETQLIISKDLDFIPTDMAAELLDQNKKVIFMLSSLIKTFK